jgi:two-component system, response regulator
MNEAPILLVENNPDDVLLTLRAFARNDFANDIIVLPDGAACVAALLPEDGRPALVPALVLLDINLPKIGGLDVLRRVRADERTRDLPVIMLTTSRERRDIVDSYRLGANSFVRKPVSFAQFAAAVQVLGTYWLRINEPCPTLLGRR